MWGQDNRCLPAAAVVQRFTDIKTKSAVHEGEIIMLGNHLLGIYEKALNPEDDWHKRLKKPEIWDLTSWRYALMRMTCALPGWNGQGKNARNSGVRSMKRVFPSFHVPERPQAVSFRKR